MVDSFENYPSREQMIEELKERNIGMDFDKGKMYEWDKLLKMNAVTCAAECDSEINFAVFHCRCELVGYIRIVHAGSSVSSEVYHFVAFSGKILYQSVLVVHACVVVANTYCHSNRFRNSIANLRLWRQNKNYICRI